MRHLLIVHRFRESPSHPLSKRLVHLHSVFCSCSQLMRVELNGGLERIERGAFEDCSSLESIRIPSTVKCISIGAFFVCHHLRNVELLEGLESIDGAAVEAHRLNGSESHPPSK